MSRKSDLLMVEDRLRRDLGRDKGADWDKVWEEIQADNSEIMGGACRVLNGEAPNGPEYQQLLADARMRNKELREQNPHKENRGRLSDRDFRFSEEFLTNRDVLIAEAMQPALRNLASERPSVVGFRQTYIENSLNRESAIRFLTSPAVNLLPKSDYIRLGLKPNHVLAWIPIISDDQATLSVDSHVIVVSNLSERDTGSSIEIEGRNFPVFRESVFEELIEVAEQLITWYPWDFQSALWFVLTDTAPAIRPLRVGMRVIDNGPGAELTYSRAIITVTADCWLSSESVLNAFQAAQRQLIGGDNKPPEARGLALFKYEEERRATWSREYPGWQEIGRRFRCSGKDPDSPRTKLNRGLSRVSDDAVDWGKMYRRVRSRLLRRTYHLPEST